MSKTFQTKKVINSIAFLVVAFMGIITTYSNCLHDGEKQLYHSTFTVGLFFLLTAIIMVLKRPAQLYAAGVLGASVLVLVNIALLSLPIPFEYVIGDNHADLYVYPSFGLLSGLFTYSLAILFRDYKMAIVTLLLALFALTGHIIQLPLLYWQINQNTQYLNADQAVCLFIMALWLLYNYFPSINIKPYFPSLTRLVVYWLEKTMVKDVKQ